MIVQAYYNESRPTMWDNATQVQWQRITYNELREKNWDGLNYISWADSQASVGSDSDSNMVKYVVWVDRRNSQPYALASFDNVFILNDDGKTIARA